MKIINTIKFIVNQNIEAVKDGSVKNNILNALPFWVGSVITGIVAVIYAKLFVWAENGTKALFDLNKNAFFFITPFCFLIAWWLVSKFAPFARGSGIPQVTVALELSNTKKQKLVTHLLSIKIIIVKIASSLVLVLGGGAIGREGPTIQIAGAIFNKINDLLPAWYPRISRKSMLVTGAAAGLAAAFNTPLGGIVFAIEELTKTHFSFFKSALLTGVIIAGLTALNILGPYLYLGYPQVNNLSYWIFIPVILVALATGISGAAMGSIILGLLKQKRTLKTTFQKTNFVLFCGLVMALCAVYIDFGVLGSGKEIMHETLFTQHKYVAWYIPFLRFIGPIFSFSVGGAGGVFAPSLSTGAAIGSAVASWFQLTATDSNLVILCGMVGFLTGVTRSPFTSCILVLEMTNASNIIFYLMLSGLVANIFARAISKRSFYDFLHDIYLREINALDIEPQNSIDGKSKTI